MDAPNVSKQRTGDRILGDKLAVSGGIPAQTGDNFHIIEVGPTVLHRSCHIIDRLCLSDIAGARKVFYRLSVAEFRPADRGEGLVSVRKRVIRAGLVKRSA
jgi:hypothetical protein